MSVIGVKAAVRSGDAPKIRSKKEAFKIARVGGWDADALIESLEQQLTNEDEKAGFFDLRFRNPRHFTWIFVAFASMDGLLSGLDQSLISGANLSCSSISA
jgi:hypothetical protein